MWRYTPYPDYYVDKPLIKRILGQYTENIPKITNESVSYINMLLSPYLTRLNTINNEEDLNQLINTVHEYAPLDLRPKILLQNKKRDIFMYLVESLLYNRYTEGNISDLAEGIINPWVLKDFIRNNRTARKIVGFPPHRYDNLPNKEYKRLLRESDDIDPDYEETPVTILVTVGNAGVDMSYDLLLGIMIIYRHFHKMHPLSYQGFIFTTEMEAINEMSFEEWVDPINGYSVHVGDTHYKFQSMDFFQGLLTGASWNNTDPHTFITNLKQWKPVTESRADRIPGNFPITQTISVDLNY